MPIYEYRCENGHTFEVVQRMVDDALTECEVCGAPAQRVLHAPSIHFKGSGFYTTDYGKKKTIPANNGSDTSSSSSDSSDSKSDKKPEKKAESKSSDKKSESKSSSGSDS